MGEFLVPLRTLADLEDAKRAARVINDHSLAKMVTRKRKIRKSRKTIFLSVLSRNKFEDTSSSPSCNLRATSAENAQSSEIQLLVRSSSRSPLCLQLYPSTTISALKGLLQEKLAIEPDKQNLFTKRHHELRDEFSLKDHGIVRDSKIDLRLVSDLMNGSYQHKSAGEALHIGLRTLSVCRAGCLTDTFHVSTCRETEEKKKEAVGLQIFI
ncbi:uncharacterized protein LOC119726921 [Patiria miniata]|uniref:Ubiquitin-like domain-containing protein n=1 Tax=Patiria miniata TaxID=46514 RepID=A0A913ZTD1_PATMI|nr:uncharacterized protein LOC119726921 [Patiria miniata]